MRPIWIRNTERSNNNLWNNSVGVVERFGAESGRHQLANGLQRNQVVGMLEEKGNDINIKKIVC